ncbi:MAG: tRNA 5-methylaminomethyl-2-thiouridine biosynthesis bifunctional protein MnmC [Planctomycetota bacterium]
MDTVLDESYHSGSGAVAESYVVYLQNSRIAARLRHSTVLPTRVFEYGFGTGMNFIITASLAAAEKKPLLFTSWEYRLLPSVVFQQLQIPMAIIAAEKLDLLHDCSTHAREITDEFLRFRVDLGDTPSIGKHRFQYTDDIVLELNIGDATTISSSPLQNTYHSIYFDAFSPKTNPDLWTEPVIRTAFELLENNGTLVTYCVNSIVRKLVAQCGFTVTKEPGPIGGKREVLVALKNPDR